VTSAASALQCWRGELHRCHARRSVWPFSKNAPCRGRRSREAGHRAEPLNYYTWRGLPCPAGVLALPQGARSSRAEPRSGPGPRVHHPARHLRVPNRRRPLHAHPVHDPCSREGDAEDYAGGSERVNKDFSIIVERQWVGGNRRRVYPRFAANSVPIRHPKVCASASLRPSLFELRRTSRLPVDDEGEGAPPSLLRPLAAQCLRACTR
jgi:hypothetical protein